MLKIGTLTGLGIFQMKICTLISKGMNENVDEIEKHLDKSDLVEYLMEKYGVKFDNKLYDIKEINRYFSNFCVRDQEERKFGIMNKEDGLLLILALIAEVVEDHCQEWSAND